LGRASRLAPLSEKEFTRQVRDLAAIYRWEFYHPWLSIHSPRGFPDVVLCRPPRLLLIELKTDHGKTSSHQDRWLELLRGCPGVEVFLWRPSDLDAIAQVLA